MPDEVSTEHHTALVRIRVQSEFVSSPSYTKLESTVRLS